MKIKYDLRRVYGDSLKRDYFDVITVENVSPRPTKFEVQLIEKQVRAAADIWYLLASRVKFVGNPDRAADFNTEIQVMQAAAVLYMFWVQYCDVPRFPPDKIITVGDEFLNFPDVISRQTWIIREFGIKKCTDKKFMQTFTKKQKYYADLLRGTAAKSFANGLTTENNTQNLTVLSRVFNPLVKSDRAAELLKNDGENSVFISELTQAEKVLLHCIVQSNQRIFYVNKNNETKCSPVEAVTLYCIVKALNIDNNSRNRQKIAAAFDMLAGRRIKFITADGVKTYSIFPTTDINFATGSKAYKINPDILNNTNLLTLLMSYYPVETLTNQKFNAIDLLTNKKNFRYDSNIAVTCIELINQLPFIDEKGISYRFSEIRKKMTYTPPKDWRRAVAGCLCAFGWEVVTNPDDKDNFILRRKKM